MKICRIKSYQQLQQLQERLNREYAEISHVEKELSTGKKESFLFPAFSYSAGKVTDLFVQKNNATAEVNWRESLVCSVTGLNNRLRAAYQFFETELGADTESVVYLSEQTTMFYKFLRSKYKNLIGSEYLNPDLSGGFINENGIRHEDLTNLSFANESVDYCISLECFEHIASYKKGFSSCYRVLKQNGALVISVPFILSNEKNSIRAILNAKNQVIHLQEPEYHLDPIDPKGCLCFTHFGWEILDELKAVGFLNAYAILYWSKEFGYLGGHQVLIIAIK